MSGVPLQPFAPPTALISFFHLDGLNGSTLLMWLLLVVFVFWAVYTLVAVYHWLKYSHGSWVAFPAIGIHIVISLTLLGFALTGSFAAYL